MKCLSSHPEDIKAAIRKEHGSLLAFERKRDLPAESVRDVLRGKAVSRTAHAIAEEMNADVHELFPGRFKSLNRDNISTPPAAHRLNAAAR
jgi:lambda repressor-like predicted transcriptional regulator